MLRRLPTLLAPVAILLVGLSAATARARAEAAQQGATADRTIWTGVYTSEQAARGKASFDTSCSRCHNLALIGSERGPALKGDGFLSHWENDSLDRLFIKIRDTMPAGGVSTLTDEAKIDVLAYLLQANVLPAGNEDLKLGAGVLEGIRIAKKGIWNGVFTAAQAERGKASFLVGRCGGCHQLDLTGDRGPALKGESFLSHWENGSVNSLFSKVRDTMPPNDAGQLPADAKLDVVAYILQSNGFPEGSAELKVDVEALESVEILRKGAAAADAPNFSLVQVVGCLSQGPNNIWTLTNTSRPLVTKEDVSTAEKLKAAAAQPLGAQTFRLVSVNSSFSPESHKGHKMEARGLLYREPSDARLNLTSLQMVASSCGPGSR